MTWEYDLREMILSGREETYTLEKVREIIKNSSAEELSDEEIDSMLEALINVFDRISLEKKEKDLKLN